MTTSEHKIYTPASTTGVAGTAGELHEERVSITFGGACPVQGYGMILDEFPCYYRARGTSWSLEVFEPGVDPQEDRLPRERSLFELGEACYAFPDGGWLSAEESVANIQRGVSAFIERQTEGVRLRPYDLGVSRESTLLESGATEPQPTDPDVDQRLANLRWRLVGIELGKLLQDGARIALDLHAPGLDTSETTEALVRGLGYGLRGNPRGVVDVPAELAALAKLAGGALVTPEGK